MFSNDTTGGGGRIQRKDVKICVQNILCGICGEII